MVYLTGCLMGSFVFPVRQWHSEFHEFQMEGFFVLCTPTMVLFRRAETDCIFIMEPQQRFHKILQMLSEPIFYFFPFLCLELPVNGHTTP